MRKRTESLGDALQLVTISIDPVNDTPEAMRVHAAERSLNLTRWTLLTGEHGLILEDLIPIPTRGLVDGKHHEKRTGYEYVLRFRKPSC